MPDMHGAVLCSERRVAVVQSAVFSADAIDIVFGPHLVFAICDPGPIFDGVNIVKGVARKTTPALAHLKNLFVVVDDDWNRKRRNNAGQGRWQVVLHQYFVGWINLLINCTPVEDKFADAYASRQ